MKGKKGGKMTVELYMEFLQNPKEIGLTVNQFNQIISMHGFAQLRSKKQIVEMASSSLIGEFMSPFRSTLKESISSSSFFSVNQVTEDLCSLQWTECSVQSVENIGLAKEKEKVQAPCSNDGDDSGVYGVVSVCKKRKQSEPSKKLDTLATLTPPASSSASQDSC